LLPYGQLSTTLSLLVLDKDWTFINILGSLGALLGIVGLVGIYTSMADDLPRGATAGFIIALIGGVLMFTALLRDTVMWPILASHDPSLLDFNGPIYSSKTFLPFFIFSGIVYAAGHVLFGLSVATSDLYPTWAGHLLAWGALLFSLGSLFGKLQVYPRSIGITALSVGLIWIGWLMRRM
jgi:hypothetical protein